MAPAPVSNKETVENPYSLGHTISQGDWVSRGTLLILTLMSMGSWYILVTKLYESLQMSREAKHVSGQVLQVAQRRGGDPGSEGGHRVPVHCRFRALGDRAPRGELTENIDRSSWVSMKVQRALDDVQSRLQDGLAFLATVGSTAPFIGLFGTVWGIYNALTAIGIAGQASIDKVAGPVGEALIMTAFGLFVAVPAVLGYNWLVRRNKVTMESVRRFGADLHGVLMGAGMSTARTAR
jgi:biopolymer transport protein ExbB